MIFFIISNEPWGEVWFSKQHYANELSKLGHKVYFVNAPTKWSLRGMFDFRIKSTKVKEHLWVLEYFNPFPLKLLPKFFLKLNDLLTSYKLGRFFNKDESVVWWQYDHKRFLNLSFNLKGAKRIYHVVDPYFQAPYNDNIASQANLIVCSHKDYLPYYQNYKYSPYYISHAISDNELILTEEEKVSEYYQKYGDFALFIGTINHSVDLNIFEHIITQTSHKIVIIGVEPNKGDKVKYEVWQKLIQHHQVIYLGKRPAEVLKYYVKASKVCFLAYPLNENKRGAVRTPLKVLNYLSQKKPIVTAVDCDIPALEHKAIYKANNISNFIELIDKGVRGELWVDEEAVTKYLHQNTYPKAIEKILYQLDKNE